MSVNVRRFACTPEEVFTALADGATLKVGDSAETAAHYLIPGPAEVQHFLEWVGQVLHEKCGGVAAQGHTG